MDDYKIERMRKIVRDLLRATTELKAMTGRSFALDGHLAGSLGEVVAAYMFGLELKTMSHVDGDADSEKGSVEIKMTAGRSIAFRQEPKHLLVLQMVGEDFHVVFNGPGGPVWKACGKPSPKNGQRSISLTKVVRLDLDVPIEARLALVRSWPSSQTPAQPAAELTEERRLLLFEDAVVRLVSLARGRGTEVELTPKPGIEKPWDGLPRAKLLGVLQRLKAEDRIDVLRDLGDAVMVRSSMPLVMLPRE